MTRFAAIALAAVIPSACMAQTDLADPCGAAGLQGLVGQTAAIVDLLHFPDRTVRIVGPDYAVTLDHRPDRLNIRIDEGVIDSILCG